MKLKKILICGLLTAAYFLGGTVIANDTANTDLQTLQKDGNWKELREETQKQLDAMQPDDPRAGDVWNRMTKGIFRSNEIALYDVAFAKYAAGKFVQNVDFFASADWGDVPGFGIILDNQFKRGPNRGNAGRNATSDERDRVQVLALMSALVPKAEKANPEVRSKFFVKLAQLLLQNRDSGSSYKLQVLTDLQKLPDYNTDEGRVTSMSRPPVNPDGSPVFYKMPGSWDKAANDGERLHYALKLANCDDARELWADFLCGQFDFLVAEQPFRHEYYLMPAMKQYLYDLKDNETIADLADGVRKIPLPDEFNYIEMYKKLGKHQRLGEIYASRMQFEKAAAEFAQTYRKELVEQLRGSWGAPDQIRVCPAGVELTIPYHYRNAKKVTVKLYRVDTGKAVDRMLKNLENADKAPLRLVNLVNIRRDEKSKIKWEDLIGKEPEKVLTVELNPLPHHWETTGYLKFGKLEPGAFVAEFVPDDNEKGSRVDSLIWAADYALTLQNNSNNGKIRLFVNDPVTGKPVPGITLKIHSFYYSYQRKGQERGKITPEVLTFQTDANGIAEFLPNVFKQPKNSYLAACYILAGTESGKRTLLHTYGLSANTNEMSPRETWRTFMITDKTVYKPGDAIAFTGYLRQPSYDGKFNMYHNKTVILHFRDPQYKEAFKKEVPFDEKTQSFTFEMKLPADAMLGTWHVSVENVPGHTVFKVEEYKKPEYLLTVTPPQKPVKAGEKMPVTIEAKYYFGAPLPDAEVSYKVFREEAVTLYPFVFTWNWLYGDRYAICTASYRDKTVRNINYGRVMIVNAKGKTDAQGKLRFEIDSADAVAKFGGKDFRYIIEAEVKDSTNRVVSGSGRVIAAVKPFQVSIYTPWGFAKTGARQQIEIAARTPNGEKVKGLGVLRIFRRALNQNGVPERTGAALKTIKFIPDGPDQPEFILNEEGVYELDAEVTSENGVTISESIPFFVVGEKQGKQLFGEYPMSLSTDKPTYQPGETAQVLVSCDKPGRTIYFITRSERDAKLECVTMDGYSKLFTIPVEKGDQPNFFMDVMSYQDGKMLTLQKQIIVPPEKKVLNVTAKPAADQVKPGATLPLKITVTGLDGKPVSGNVTVTVYDKSLEAVSRSVIPALQPVSGNVTVTVFDKSLEAVSRSVIPAIQPFFWGWTRWNHLGFTNNFLQWFGMYHENPGMWRNIENSFHIPFHNDDGSPFYYGRRYRREKLMLMNCNAVAECDSVADGEAVMMECAAAAPAPAAKFAPEMKAKGFATGAGGAEPEEEASPAVRTNFLDRAFWAGRINLPESGETTVNIPVPDNLTTWVIRVWSLTPDTRVGEARTEIVVSKDLIARLELPRFMVQGDTVNAVVTINNTTSNDFGEVETTLTAPGLIKEVHTQKVTLKANGAVSYEVPLTANEVGEYTLTLSAKSGKETDALELKLPVLVKGIDKQVNTCGRLDAGKTKTSITLDVPEKRRPETTAFALYLSPGAAKNMIELLPYLAADDSGDVFGIVNRFVPALSAKIALDKLDIKWEDAAPEKTSRDKLYAEYMQRYTWHGSAVPSFKAEDFDRVIAENLRMIAKMVNSDGGWGWFGAYHEQSWADTTAYVVDALLDVQDKVDRDLIDGGIAWLERHAAERVARIKGNKEKWVGNTDALVARVLAKAGKPNPELMKFCYDFRVKCLAPYGYAMLALAYGKDTDEAKMLIRNLEQFLKADDENGTAYLNIPAACCFFWYGNENETLAAYLELLLRNDPKGSTAQKVANYLVTNVRNSPWRNSTRSLGAAVRALANYIVVSGEGKPEFTVTVRDGSEEHKYTFNAQNMWKNDGPALFLPADKLKAGKRTIELEFSGSGALYWNGMLNYFSLEDKIEPAGLEMKIQRNYYRLVEDTDASSLLAGKRGVVMKESTLKYKRIPLKDGDTVKPGDLVEVELLSSAKNDYDYVVFQDSMPAGFEYEKPVSGWRWNWAAPMYVEYKERGAKFYLRNMARGQSNAFYRIRAQLCGTVTALPARGYGIYAPELKCNGAQQTLKTVK